MKELKEITKFKNKVNNFIFDWHKFPIDFWWRKKYNVPFGSSLHREMNFIDMLIEYKENFLMNKSLEEYENEEIELYEDSNERAVKLSKSEIDEDFDNLDLEQFNK